MQINMQVKRDLMCAILAIWEAENKRIKIQGQPGQTARPHLQNSQSRMDWRSASSSTATAMQVQGPEFKL
jgi:hypothetical protein